MGRETEDEKVDRWRRAGRWLRRERDDRRLNQKQVADRLGVTQQTYSTYERGLAEIPHEFAAELAAVLGLPEEVVWFNLEMPRPSTVRTDADVIAWARDFDREVLEKGSRVKQPPAPTVTPPPVDRPTDDTRSGEPPRHASHGGDCAI
jgi:transcriptional regulator with XRE-family HTH domain